MLLLGYLHLIIYVSNIMATNKNEKIFHPLQAFLMVLMVNARHLFYGLSMLEKYKGLGWTIPWRRWQP